MKYLKIPSFITYKKIVNNNFSLSSSQYRVLLKNSDVKFENFNFFLEEKLTRKFLGNEIGSNNYMIKSNYYFMRTKALQSYSYIPVFSDNSLLPMLPSSFSGIGLKKGDLLISKDGNIGETILVDKDYPNIMVSGAIYNLPVKEKYKKYILAITKNLFFREQLNVLVPKGATLRHAKTLFLKCLIPIPTEENLEIINRLVFAIVEMERKIKELFDKTLRIIDEELENGKNNNNFKFYNPNFLELTNKNRLDTGIYCEKYKSYMFKIRNYKNGYSNIQELDMKLSRGQNLQVSNIGKSVYTNKKYSNFYQLILPKYLSKYGTVNTFSYLGNINKLKTLEKGDIIFAAEGFEKGRSIVVIDELKKAITNIHGITIKQNKKHDLNKGIFVKQILDWYREKGLIDLIATGGNGGSISISYWEELIFPDFSINKKIEMALLYYNKNCENSISINDINIDKWKEKIIEYIKEAGIVNLDNMIKELKEYLNNYIEKML